jgi:hypothetical protein
VVKVDARCDDLMPPPLGVLSINMSPRRPTVNHHATVNRSV